MYQISAIFSLRILSHITEKYLIPTNIQLMEWPKCKNVNTLSNIYEMEQNVNRNKHSLVTFLFYLTSPAFVCLYLFVYETVRLMFFFFFGPLIVTWMITLTFVQRLNLQSHQTN